MTKDKLRYGPLRVGIGGPVGAGKTSMTEALCRALGDDVSMAVITNDIYTSEDADYLVRAQAHSLPGLDLTFRHRLQAPTYDLGDVSGGKEGDGGERPSDVGRKLVAVDEEAEEEITGQEKGD